MKKFIIKTNEWFDNLKEPKRTLYFLLVICGSLVIAQVIDYIIEERTVSAFIIWFLIFAFWRGGYTFISWSDWHKNKDAKK